MKEITHKKNSKKVALITGASRGIGKAVLLELGKKDDIVIAGVDLTKERSDSITTLCQQHSINGQGFEMDVANPKSVEATLAKITDTFGYPAILVNNAGITRDSLIIRMNLEDWSDVINTNLNSVYYLSKACIRDMLKAKWGRIINISSVVAFTGNAGQANYAAAKGAVLAFSKTLALEVASRGITVNTIAPGFIETDMTGKLTGEQRERILNIIPMHHMGKPEDIAKAVTFLVSTDAAYITGTTLHVNGGLFLG